MADIDSSLKRRVGRISIADNIIDDIEQNEQILNMLFGRLIVIRCEHNYLSRTFDYLALSPDFEVINEGQVTPIYDSIINHHENGDINISFEKL